MPTVLIVDDAAFMRVMLREILNRFSFEVVGEAEDGEGALARYRELNPDLVLLDIIMPGSDGIEVLKKLKEIDSAAKVIMISAMGQKTFIEEAHKLGASGYIIKPFSPQKVVAVLKEVLDKGASEINNNSFTF